MRVDIGKSVLSGVVTAPPSKSMAHRLLICSGLCSGKSIVQGISPSEDILATLDCLKSIGADLKFENGTVTITGADIFSRKPAQLYCRESGSTLRFFIPICLLNENEVVIHGSEKLLSRPLEIYENICMRQNIEFKNDGKSVHIKGKLKSGDYRLAGNISSQFISGLLFALPLLEGDSTIDIIPPVESGSYINLTIQALSEFGIHVERPNDRTLYIRGGQRYMPTKTTVEGDYSNSAFFEAMNCLGANIRVDGLRSDSLQGDRVYREYFDMLKRGTPTIHISDCPDLGPVLFAVAAFHSGGVFTGTRRLKIKESDRACAMTEELKKFGVSVKSEDDTVIVYPAQFHKPETPLYGHNDHRIVMALSVLLTAVGGSIDGAEAVRKSMPDFFEKIAELGAEVKISD